jgi:4-hydroxyphenylpyruvate dioxygenase-like putative hemolysin
MHVEERNPEPSNPLGMDGIEFIEFATSQPQALGGLCSGWASRRSPATARAK